MRVDRTKLVTAAVVLAAASLWPATAAAAGGPKREVFIAGGWSQTDEEAGTDTSRTLIASGPDGGTATIEYATMDARRITCGDGSPGATRTEGLGIGAGALHVDPNLEHATLEGTVELTTETWTFCGTGEEPVVQDLGEVSVSLALTGTGKRWREVTGGTRASPSDVNLAWRWQARGRQATGTLVAGVESHATQFADFGLGVSRTHTPAGDLLLAASRWWALRTVASGMDIGSMLRAEAIWEQSAGDVYDGVYLGADRFRRGGTTLYYTRYATRPTECGDGTPGTIDTFGSGVGPGRLDLNGGLRTGRASGVVDITLETVDSCTGGSTITTLDDVPVALAVTGTGPLVRGTDWEGIHVPSVLHTTSWVGLRTREGTGSMTIGADVLDASWARLLSNSWRIR